MKDGKCPKCGSDKVYSSERLLFKGGPFASNSIPVGLTSLAALDNYVCTKCGLVESYVADSDKLKEIERRWDNVAESDSAES